MESTPTDELWGAIIADVERRQTVVMDDARDQVRQRLSVPVVRAGGKVIRSKEGEAARKDSGDLVASIESNVASSGDTIEAVLSTDRHYGPILETKLRRLVMTDLAESFDQPILDATVSGIEGD